MNNYERIKQMSVDEMAEYFLLNYEKVKLFKGRFCGLNFLKQWLLTECEKWKSKYYSSTTEVKADLIKQLNQLKREIDITSCANIELSLELKKYEKAIDEINEIADNNYENPEMERIINIIEGLDE